MHRMHILAGWQKTKSINTTFQALYLLVILISTNQKSKLEIKDHHPISISPLQTCRKLQLQQKPCIPFLLLNAQCNTEVVVVVILLTSKGFNLSTFS